MPAPAIESKTAAPLLDTFGRVANELRVSLTDRCDLRCTSCMPVNAELVPLPGITVERVGIREVRFIGGNH